MPVTTAATHQTMPPNPLLVSLGAALILVALLPALAALVGGNGGRQWNKTPSRWDLTRPSRFRNPSGDVAHSASTPRFPAPIPAVNAHPSNRAWTTSVYAHTINNPVVRYFSSTEAKTIQLPQPHYQG